MASGTLDTNGVWIYGEDDPASPFSDLLNLGMDSASDAIGTLRSRVTAIEGQQTAERAAWIAYTPTLANITLGNGTVTARYKRVGSVIHAMGVITLGTTTSMGNVVIGTPTTMAGLVSDRVPLGTAMYTDASAGLFLAGPVRPWSASSVVCHVPAGQIVAPTLPFTWASTDTLGWHFTYEVAP